jgi:hypothetical protein
LFGSDASRAAEITFQAQKAAVEGTGEGYKSLLDAVQPAGQAVAVGAAKMAGMNGAIEQLSGSIDTAKIAFGAAFLPVVEQVALKLTDLVNVFTSLPQPIQQAIAFATAGAAGFLAIGSAIGFIIGPLGGFLGMLGPVAAGIAAIAAPLALVVAGLAALKIAYDQNLGGFADAVNAAASGITSALQPVIGIFQTLATQLASGDLSGALQTFVSGLPAIGQALGNVAQIIGDLGARAIPALVGAFQVVDWSAVGDAIGAGIQSALSTLSNFGAWVLNALTGGAGGGGGAGSLAGDITQWIADRFTEIDWSQLGAALLSGAQRAAALLLDFGQWGLDRLSEIGQWILNAISGIDWGSVGAAIQTGLQSASDALAAWIQEQSTNLGTAFSSMNWSAVADAIGTGIQNAISTLGDFAGFLLEKGGQLVAGIVQGISDHLADVGTKLGEIATGAAAVLPDALTLLLQKGADLIAGIVQGVGDHLPDIATKLGEIATGAASVLPDALTLLLSKGPISSRD